MTLRVAAECDVIILNLDNPTPDVEPILKCKKSIYLVITMRKQLNHPTKKQTLIGLSSFATSLYTTPNLVETDVIDR